MTQDAPAPLPEPNQAYIFSHVTHAVGVAV